MIDIIIGIQNMGSDTGPTFDLYSDLDVYQVPFEINVSKVDLLVGYNTTAPTGSTIIRVKSKGDCETYIDIPILLPTTTTTTTLPPETTTTTTSTTTTSTTTLPPDTTTTSTTTLPPDTTTTSTTTLPPDTTTTTTLPTINYQLQMSVGADSLSSVNCNSTFISNPGRYTIETIPVLSDYPQAGKIIYNANGTPFNGGNKYYRIQFSIISTSGESIIARVASNGFIYAQQQICSGSFGF